MLERAALLCKLDKLSERCAKCDLPPFPRGHCKRDAWCKRFCFHTKRLMVIGKKLNKLEKQARKMKNGPTRQRQTA